MGLLSLFQVLNVTGNVAERIARFQRMVDEKEQ